MKCTFLSLGRGIPNILASQNNRTSQSHYSVVPTPEQAVASYRASGGCLSMPSQFGYDPSAGHEGFQSERERAMDENIT